MDQPVESLPTAEVRATQVAAPPAWALLERQLIELMSESAALLCDKYSERGGVLYFCDDVDDLYEPFHNWATLYAMGGDEFLLTRALDAWNAVTRSRDDRVEHLRERFRPQIHNEYYNLVQPEDWVPGNRLCSEWHHQSEGNMCFYSFGYAAPTLSENVRRARRFAAMLMGEDPEAPNWDAEHKRLRSPIQSSQGPYTRANITHVQQWLHGAHRGGPRPLVKPMGVRASLYPVVKELEMDWMDRPERAAEIIELFNEMVLDCDTPNNLAATALVTNAYLYTGEAKYKTWVLDYVDRWMEDSRKNDGILPDNVGPGGIIGEHRQGQWWGSLYGWNHYQGFNIMYHGMVVAAECAQLLSGDDGYMDFIRSQVEMLLANARQEENGQVLIPLRYGPDGWESYQPVRILEPAHLYHGTLAPQDYELMVRIRAGDVERDWNQIRDDGDKNVQTQDGHQNMARFNYYDGKNPQWPQCILESDYRQALRQHKAICAEDRSPQQMIEENVSPPFAVYTKALEQVMQGAPQTEYNGGLSRALVRYFDRDRSRPGLPPDVAALVDEIGADKIGVQLVNLNRSQTRRTILQPGAFGEHSFTQVGYAAGDKKVRTPLDDKGFGVVLPPATAIRLEIGMRRFCNDPSYAFPWHGEKVPVPFA